MIYELCFSVNKLGQVQANIHKLANQASQLKE
jgi:X-X-X-Leu-X-X-Gly heptad repeat protein